MDRQFLRTGMILFVLILIQTPLYALVPLENIILGDFTKRYEEKSSDPLDYIFQLETIKDKYTNRDYKEELALYRGFYQEGKNLENFCETRPEIIYSKPFDRVQSKRSIIATFQYIGLDLTVRALPQYAKFFEFSRDEYSNLVDNLVGNYCSENLSIISIKQLRNNFMVKFDKDNSFQLPSIQGNPLFTKEVRNFVSLDQAREREFQQTVKLFKSFCSWGGDPDDLRLLVPLVRNPVVMSFVIRQLAGKALAWGEVNNKILLREEPRTSKVICQDLICRKADDTTFNDLIPKGVGSTSIQTDFNRLYCQSLRDVDFINQGQEPKIKKMYNQMTFDDHNLMISQLISLVTKFPDFIVRSEKVSDAQEYIRSSLDIAWDKWAKEQSERFDKDLYYEEPLTIEVVDRKIFYNRFIREFQVSFDVNLGEFDRVNQVIGKMETHFEVKVSKSFLRWVRREWVELDPRIKGAREKIIDRFKKVIEDEVKKAKAKIPLPSWRGDLEGLIVEEILTQLALFRGKFYPPLESGIVTIPIRFYYSPFALKYLHFLNKIERSRKEGESISGVAKNP